MVGMCGCLCLSLKGVARKIPARSGDPDILLITPGVHVLLDGPLQADLQKQVQRERALAEAEGRIKEGRENEDIARRAQLLKYQEAAKKSLESINAVMSQVGVALTDLLTDRNKLIATVSTTRHAERNSAWAWAAFAPDSLLDHIAGDSSCCQDRQCHMGLVT